MGEEGGAVSYQDPDETVAFYATKNERLRSRNAELYGDLQCALGGALWLAERVAKLEALIRHLERNPEFDIEAALRAREVEP